MMPIGWHAPAVTKVVPLDEKVLHQADCEGDFLTPRARPPDELYFVAATFFLLLFGMVVVYLFVGGGSQDSFLSATSRTDTSRCINLC
jgi:hypothetical protein